jgi:hypothetical protein
MSEQRGMIRRGEVLEKIEWLMGGREGAVGSEGCGTTRRKGDGKSGQGRWPRPTNVSHVALDNCTKRMLHFVLGPA